MGCNTCTYLYGSIICNLHVALYNACVCFNTVIPLKKEYFRTTCTYNYMYFPFWRLKSTNAIEEGPIIVCFIKKGVLDLRSLLSKLLLYIYHVHVHGIWKYMYMYMYCNIVQMCVLLCVLDHSFSCCFIKNFNESKGTSISRE